LTVFIFCNELIIIILQNILLLTFYFSQHYMEANPYLEALRYLANAKETLQKAGKENGRYKDVKYVKTATGTAYSGILVALDEYLKQKEGHKYKKPKSIEDYTQRLQKQNQKITTLLSNAYGLLHLTGYYGGTDSVKIVTEGLEEAQKIIEYIKPPEEKKPLSEK
jgi:hypothetical protein